MDFNQIREAAKGYEKDMTRFLRDIVKFPGESCGEKDHIERIAEEMRKTLQACRPLLPQYPWFTDSERRFLNDMHLLETN